MGKFNTHGGYFAPQNYFKVTTGGSHAENPNGGVQIGTDPQGIPNMLEEGEPVYDDFVYSDNIRADAKLLKKYNIPEKYAGKLFSEIADLFVDEATLRPNDPISNNGLNEMLVRLADAQEEQKQIAEQAELEKQLAALDPEQLAEIQQMAVSPEQVEQEVPTDYSQEIDATDEQPVMPQLGMMANGGFIRTFEDGTPGTVVSQSPLVLDPETGNYYIEDYEPQNFSVHIPSVYEMENPGLKFATPAQDEEVVDEGIKLGTLDAASTSAKLSRDDWDRLYKNGKVELNSIPKQYRNWIQGNNSGLKQRITNAMDNAGRQIFDAAKTGAEFVAPEIMFPAEFAANLAAGNKDEAAIDALGTLASAATHVPVQDVATLGLFSPVTKAQRRMKAAKTVANLAVETGNKKQAVAAGKQVIDTAKDAKAAASAAMERSSNAYVRSAQQAAESTGRKMGLAKGRMTQSARAVQRAEDKYKTAVLTITSESVKQAGRKIGEGVASTKEKVVRAVTGTALPSGPTIQAAAETKTAKKGLGKVGKFILGTGVVGGGSAGVSALVKNHKENQISDIPADWQQLPSEKTTVPVVTTPRTVTAVPKSKYTKSTFANGGLMNTYAPGGYLEDFVDYLTQDNLENSQQVKSGETRNRGGWDSVEQRWYPHPSPEGGEDTIAYGLKLYNGRNYTDLVAQQGYLTPEQARQFTTERAQLAMDGARKFIDEAGGEGTFDNMPKEYQLIMSDIFYQTKSPTEFTGLRNAMLAGDNEAIRKHMMTHYRETDDGPWLDDNNRYKYKQALMDNLEAMATNQSGEPAVVSAKGTPREWKESNISAPVVSPAAGGVTNNVFVPRGYSVPNFYEAPQEAFNGHFPDNYFNPQARLKMGDYFKEPAQSGEEDAQAALDAAFMAQNNPTSATFISDMPVNEAMAGFTDTLKNYIATNPLKSSVQVNAAYTRSGMPEEFSAAEKARIQFLPETTEQKFTPDTRFKNTFTSLSTPEIDYSRQTPEVGLYPTGYSIFGKNFTPKYLNSNGTVDNTAAPEKIEPVMETTPVVASDSAENTTTKFSQKPLSTWQQYAGPVGDSLIAAFNALQPETKFTMPHNRVPQVSGRRALVNPAYNPLDANAYVNNALASSASAARNIRNSGVSPATGALLLANNYNTNNTLGNIIQQTGLQNATLKNNIIQQRNANASSIGTFDVNNANRNAQALMSDYATRLPYELQTQRLNDASSSAKWAAVSSPLTSVQKSLQNIGKQNINANMIMNNPNNAYAVDPTTGFVYFNQAVKTEDGDKKCGGKIRRKNK